MAERWWSRGIEPYAIPERTSSKKHVWCSVCASVMDGQFEHVSLDAVFFSPLFACLWLAPCSYLGDDYCLCNHVRSCTLIHSQISKHQLKLNVGERRLFWKCLLLKPHRPWSDSAATGSDHENVAGNVMALDHILQDHCVAIILLCKGSPAPCANSFFGILFFQAHSRLHAHKCVYHNCFSALLNISSYCTAL